MKTKQFSGIEFLKAFEDPDDASDQVFSRR